MANDKTTPNETTQPAADQSSSKEIVIPLPEPDKDGQREFTPEQLEEIKAQLSQIRNIYTNSNMQRYNDERGKDVAQTVVDLTEQIAKNLNTAAETMGERFTNIVAQLSKATDQIVERYEAAEKIINDFINSPKFNELSKYVSGLAESMQNNKELDVFYCASVIENIDELQQVLETQLEKYKKEHNLTDITLEELITDIDENGEPVESIIDQLFDAAQAAQLTQELLPSTAVIRADKIERPIDKANSIVWNMLAKDLHGQLTFAAEKRGSKKELNIYYSIDFSELTNVKISKQLTSFDKRVYTAISALFNKGNSTITLTLIYYAMGNDPDKKPARNQLEKIDQSVEKMTKAQITLDNAEEAAAYKRYPLFQYGGSLLPIEWVKATINGQLAEKAIHIFREPPLMTFAKQRKQITTIDIKLLQSPFNKTEQNLLIDDYLLDRIAKMKHGKGSNRILFETLYKAANITSRMQRSRAPEKIKGYLDYYKECKHIKRYTVEADGVTIYF